MFKPITGGSVEEIQGLKCHIPKVGYIYDYHTNKYENVGVIRRAVTPGYQYWERDKDFDKVRDWELECKKKGIDRSEHQEYSDFIKKCWRYRLGGCWFSNNGVPTYITGKNWYFLSCYTMDIGYPDYRDIDREYFYAIEWAFENPNCFGLVEARKRRDGKSYRCSCIGIDLASRSMNFNVGIQSKTDTDAQKFFKKNVVTPLKNIPPFFRPNINLPASGKAPANELKFENAKIESDDDELMSMIDYQSSAMGAYDGQKLGLYIGDEVAKPSPVNVYDRYDVIKFCLKDSKGKIIGKTIHTTTVEKEKDSKGVSKQDKDTCDKIFYQLWSDSNQYELDEENTTKSGLVRFFIPADRTRNEDKHGIADRAETMATILRERKKVKDNPRALANLIRKEPLSEREMFQVDGDNCVFGNPVMLQQRYDDLLFLPKQYKVGNFHWEHGIRDGAVYLEECEGGRFMVAHEPPEGQRNLTIKRSYSYVPNNKENYVAGIDPVDYKVVSGGMDKRMSFPSLSIVKKIDPVNPTRYDNNLVCLYLFRPQLPETFYEDCVKALKYYGCEALIERNKGNIITYFEEQGYAEYAAWMEGQNERGIYNTSRESGGGINGKITEIIDQWTESGVDGCMFPILLEQLLIFDPTNTTKFDAAMSFGYALMLLKKYVSRQKRAEKNKASIDISGWFG